MGWYCYISKIYLEYFQNYKIFKIHWNKGLGKTFTLSLYAIHYLLHALF